MLKREIDTSKSKVLTKVNNKICTPWRVGYNKICTLRGTKEGTFEGTFVLQLILANINNTKFNSTGWEQEN